MIPWMAEAHQVKENVGKTLSENYPTKLEQQ